MRIFVSVYLYTFVLLNLQVRVYDELSNKIRDVSATLNEIVIKDLQPESLYFVDVRGKYNLKMDEMLL